MESGTQFGGQSGQITSMRATSDVRYRSAAVTEQKGYASVVGSDTRAMCDATRHGNAQAIPVLEIRAWFARGKYKGLGKTCAYLESNDSLGKLATPSYFFGMPG
jgi:hypothetical protein